MTWPTFWQFFTFFDNIWQFWQFLTMFNNFDNFYNFDNINNFENFDIFLDNFSQFWDTDYNSDNWEPEFMTIIVTWQLRVTLDSIRNSCDVWFLSSRRNREFLGLDNVCRFLFWGKCWIFGKAGGVCAHSKPNRGCPNTERHFAEDTLKHSGIFVITMAQKRWN